MNHAYSKAGSTGTCGTAVCYVQGNDHHILPHLPRHHLLCSAPFRIGHWMSSAHSLLLILLFNCQCLCTEASVTWWMTPGSIALQIILTKFTFYGLWQKMWMTVTGIMGSVWKPDGNNSKGVLNKSGQNSKNLLVLAIITYQPWFKDTTHQVWKLNQWKPTSAVYHYLPTMVQRHNTPSLEAESMKTYRAQFIITYQPWFKDTTHQVWKLNQWKPTSAVYHYLPTMV